MRSLYLTWEHPNPKRLLAGKVASVIRATLQSKTFLTGWQRILPFTYRKIRRPIKLHTTSWRSLTQNNASTLLNNRALAPGRNRNRKSQTHLFLTLSSTKRLTSTEYRNSWLHLNLPPKTRMILTPRLGAKVKSSRIVSNIHLSRTAWSEVNFCRTIRKLSGMTILSKLKTWLPRKLVVLLIMKSVTLTKWKLRHQRSCSKCWDRVVTASLQPCAKTWIRVFQGQKSCKHWRMKLEITAFLPQTS